MTSDGIAWFAGLFEGEGSIYAEKNGRDNGVTLTIVIAMTDKDTIEQIVDVVGAGGIQGPYFPDTQLGRTKPIWRWRLRSRDASEKLAELIRPWLSSRRRCQVDRAVDKMPPRRFAAGTRGAQI